MEKENFERRNNINKSNRKRKVSISNSYTDDEINRREFGVSYKSKRNALPLGPNSQGATAANDNEAQAKKDKDFQGVFEKSLKINKLEGEITVDRGTKNYNQYIEKEDTAAGNTCFGMVRKYPISAPVHQDQATVRFRWDWGDYQPDICKDYKETGLCGFGDSCKFLHDDSEWPMSAWQMEESWAAEQKGECDYDDTKNEIHSVDESQTQSPTIICFLCGDDYFTPVVTKCKRYICEECAEFYDLLIFILRYNRTDETKSLDLSGID